MPVSAEASRRCELAQQVPDHVLGDEDRHVFLPVVNRERVPISGKTLESRDQVLITFFSFC